MDCSASEADPVGSAEQTACEDVCKGLEARLSLIERESFIEPDSSGEAGATRPVRKATAAALRHATEIQADSEASLVRSQQIVLDAQETGTDTAILLKAQTEQLKSIYAEVSEMDDNIKKAKK